MMKLGIVVVYIVSEENKRLLDLHLSQINKHTQVPYTIYASANRLLPKFRQKLERYPEIKVCDFPTTELRDKYEHSYYLERLVGVAIDDGASHVVTLHTDSFPIRSGWAKELADILKHSYVFAMPQKYHFTACLFFSADFYRQYQPRFLLSEDECATLKYQQFNQAFEHVPDSGHGYAFTAFSERLSWYPLIESNIVGTRNSHGGIYHDLVFHLHSTIYYESVPLKSTSLLRSKLAVSFIQRIRWVSKFLVPNRLRQGIRTGPLRGLVKRIVFKPILEYEKEQLFADPENYLKSLQSENNRNKIKGR